MNTPYYDLCFLELSSLISIALHSLTEKERLVIEMRFFEGYTLKKCSNLFGCCIERIRQIESNALRKLRRPDRIFLFMDGIDYYRDGMLIK